MTTKFDASVAMTSSMNKACASMTGDFSMEVVRTLAEMYKFDADEAIRTLGLSCITIKKTKKNSASASASASSASSSAKPATKKAPKAKWETPTCILPWCGTAFPNKDFCQGLRLNHGLHSQCTMKSVNGGMYCTTCQKQADKNENGKPTYGDVEMRSKVGLLDYRDPKSNKQTIPYANIMQKLKIPMEVAMFQATAFGLEIPEEHLVFRKTMRGRPKAARTSIVSDDENKPKAKRGRPKKPKKVIESATGDDLIASLVAQASISSHEPETPVEATPIQVEATPIQVEATPIQVEATPIQVEATPIQVEATPIQVEAKPEEATSSASESEGEGAKKKKGRRKKELTPEEIEAKKKKRNEAAKKRRAAKKAAAEQAAIESDEEAEFQEVCKIVQDELKAMDLACDPREAARFRSKPSPRLRSKKRLFRSKKQRLFRSKKRLFRSKKRLFRSKQRLFRSKKRLFRSNPSQMPSLKKSRSLMPRLIWRKMKRRKRRKHSKSRRLRSMVRITFKKSEARNFSTPKVKTGLETSKTMDQLPLYKLKNYKKKKTIKKK